MGTGCCCTNPHVCKEGLSNLCTSESLERNKLEKSEPAKGLARLERLRPPRATPQCTTRQVTEKPVRTWGRKVGSEQLSAQSDPLVAHPIMKAFSEKPPTVQGVLEFKPHPSKLSSARTKSSMSGLVPVRVEEPEGVKIELPEGEQEPRCTVMMPSKEPTNMQIEEETKLSPEAAAKLLGKGGTAMRKFTPATMSQTTGNFVSRFSSINFMLEAENLRGENVGFLEEKYAVLEFVDRGSFGEVKKVRETATGRIRALKVINKGKCQMTDSFADEIAILKKLVASEG